MAGSEIENISIGLDCPGKDQKARPGPVVQDAEQADARRRILNGPGSLNQ